MHRFTIQPFPRHFLEEMFLLYRNADAKVRNRFCLFFAHIMKQMTITERRGERFSLSSRAVLVLLDGDRQPSEALLRPFLWRFLQRRVLHHYQSPSEEESFDFYESMCNAARGDIRNSIMGLFCHLLGKCYRLCTESNWRGLSALHEGIGLFETCRREHWSCMGEGP